MTSGQLIEKLGDCFATELRGEGPAAAAPLWDEIEIEGSQSSLGLFTHKDQRWVLAHLTDVGRAKLTERAADRSRDWQGLGVSILHRLVIETLLEATDLPKPMYVHDVAELVAGLEQGDSAGRDATGQMGSGGAFNLATLVMPATLEHIRCISQHGERMPAKSTYFYPKLLSGLVINPLE